MLPHTEYAPEYTVQLKLAAARHTIKLAAARTLSKLAAARHPELLHRVDANQNCHMLNRHYEWTDSALTCITISFRRKLLCCNSVLQYVTRHDSEVGVLQYVVVCRSVL